MDNLILIDTSGSMMEDGKRSVIMYVLNTIKNIAAGEPEIYLWSSEIKPFCGKMEFGAANDLNSISDFLSLHKDKPILIITDGCFPQRIKSVLKEHSGNLVFIIVGVDSSVTALQKLFGANNVFEAADTAACVYRHLVLKGGV